MSKLLTTLLVLLAALFATKFFQKGPATAAIKPLTTTAKMTSIFDSTIPKTPVYFFSHGGPTFMYEEDKGAFKATAKIGKFIRDQIKPKFIVVVSAHWESNIANTIEIAVPKSNTLENELIYDFYGFPNHMYKEKFRTKTDLELANDIKESLKSNGVHSQLTTRGIDHGTWVPFKVAFATSKPEGAEFDLDIPLVQVSLSGTGDFHIHDKLGSIISKYREQGGVVICSGMSVHNLRDLGHAYQLGKAMPYVTPFNKLLTDIITRNENRSKRLELLDNLKINHRDLLYKSHPTLEHFMPIVVASGASENEKVKELHNEAELSLGWGIYQFGEWHSTKA